MSADVDLELVRALQPDSGASSEARNQARAALLVAIGNTDNPGPQRARARLGLALLPSIGLIGAAVAVAAAIVITAGLNGGAGQPASAAAAMLQRAARVASASGGPRELGPGEYWYVHSRETVSSAVFPAKKGNRGHVLVIVDALTSYDRQDWIGVDKRGYYTTRIVRIQFLSAAAQKRWERDGRPAPLSVQGSSSLPADAFDRPYKQLLALPTNVDALYKVVQGDAGKGSAVWQRHEMFTVIGDLLRMDPIPARVRAALYRVAARIPGIQALGLTHDGLGRPALAIALNDTLYGQRDELLFDPRTASLLGETSVVVKPGPKYHVKPGTVRTGSTYITSGIVQRIGQHPGRQNQVGTPEP
jgi:hypothetical protein